MRLMVCPKTQVPNFRDAPVTHFLSLVDPGDNPEELTPPRATKDRLILTFSDLDDIEMTLPRFRRYMPPREDDVKRIVDFGTALADSDDWGLLAHCEAGISRSTAAAIAALTAAGYPPETAFELVQRVCPEMLPNRRILRIADICLGTGGTLHSMAVEHRRKAFEMAGYEDPTEVLYRESLKAHKSLLGRFLGIFPSNWRNIVGTGARMRAAKSRPVAYPRQAAATKDLRGV
jgi:predicted protein tyrosine phosphatase